MIHGSTARAGFSLRASQAAGFAMHHRASWEPPAPVWSQAEIAACLDATVVAWRTWSGLHQRCRGPWAQLVHHGGCEPSIGRFSRTSTRSSCR
jgi:alpha,alpha-trehalase